MSGLAIIGFYCEAIVGQALRLLAFVGDRHSERSAAESKNPAERPVCFASGFLDFARNDSKINCVSEFQFGGEFVHVIRVIVIQISST